MSEKNGNRGLLGNKGRYNISMDVNVKRQFKAACEKNGTSMSTVIELFATKYIENTKKITNE